MVINILERQVKILKPMIVAKEILMDRDESNGIFFITDHRVCLIELQMLKVVDLFTNEEIKQVFQT